MAQHQQGTRAKDLFAALRNEVPEFAQAERDLGSRLVVAKNVMRLRIQRGYTQRQLADELKIKQPRIAEIESARANLQIDTLDRIAGVFSVETASLFKVEKRNTRRPAAYVQQPIHPANQPRERPTDWGVAPRAFAPATVGIEGR